MRRWLVVGLGLVIVGFAFTVAIDLFRIAPEVGDESVSLPPVSVDVESLREAPLEREARPSPTARPAGTSRAESTKSVASAPREQVHRHPDGSVRDRVLLDDSGAPHGTYASFHPNGAPWETGAYEHGKKDGLWRAFHENGALREESTWDGGVQRGLVRQWDLEGNLIREAHVDGQLEGVCTTWYPTGQLESRGRYSSGRREGRWEFWQTNGELDPTRTGTYLSDQRTGD
ncbi:MAG: hypothetical protein U1F29_15505 [Planctomycetota bacterium]